MKKRQYVVFRHGCNSANQSMVPVAPVGIWETETRQEALDIAAEQVVVFNNQHLTAKPASRCSAADNNAAVEADYARLEAGVDDIVGVLRK